MAVAARADGVHIGPDDMTPEDARVLLGPDAIMGVSIKSVAAAEAAPSRVVQLCGRRRRLHDALEGTGESPRSGKRKGLRALPLELRRRAPKVPASVSFFFMPPMRAAVRWPPAPTVSQSSRRCHSPGDCGRCGPPVLRPLVDGMLAKRGT